MVTVTQKVKCRVLLRSCCRRHKINVTVTLTHYGGDTISNAFTPDPCPELGDKWGSLELRYNGAKVTSSTANILELNGAMLLRSGPQISDRAMY